MGFNPVPFDEGDRVIHKTRLDRGTVLEIDDGTVYIEMDNGVEMDFHVSELMMESEYKTPADIEREKMDAVDADKKAAAEIIWPKLRPATVRLVELYHANIAMAANQLFGSATPWAELTAYHKMNFLVVLSKFSFEKWMEANNNGKLHVLEIAILMQIGEALKKS